MQQSKISLRKPSTWKIAPLNPPNIKTYLNKPYTLVRSEKYEQFLTEIGVDKETKKKIFMWKPTVTLSMINDQYVLTTSYPDQKPQRLKFRNGEEMQRQMVDGRIVKSTFQVKGHKIVEKQKIGDKSVLISREFDEDDLLITMTVNCIKCHRIYKVGPSKHSIGTETSRRASLFRNVDEAEALKSPSIQSSFEEMPDSEAEESEEEICL